MAYLFAELEPGRELYMELPELLGQGGVRAPGEYKGCGSGRGSGKVARLKRYLYGLADSGRAFSRKLQEFFDGLNGEGSSCRALTSDRMTFRWRWRDADGKEQTLNCAAHVGDLVCAPSSDSIKAEFHRRLKAFFGQDRITGGEPTSYVLGMRIDRDRDRKELKISQGGFVRELMKKFGVKEGQNVKKSPLPGKFKLEKFEGQATDEEIATYLSLVGSLQWLSISCRPDVTHAASLLGRASRNPSPQAMEGARHVSTVIPRRYARHGDHIPWARRGADGRVRPQEQADRERGRGSRRSRGREVDERFRDHAERRSRVLEEP
jgi:hypothetical protein